MGRIRSKRNSIAAEDADLYCSLGTMGVGSLDRMTLERVRERVNRRGKVQQFCEDIVTFHKRLAPFSTPTGQFPWRLYRILQTLFSPRVVHLGMVTNQVDLVGIKSSLKSVLLR